MKRCPNCSSRTTTACPGGSRHCYECGAYYRGKWTHGPRHQHTSTGPAVIETTQGQP